MNKKDIEPNLDYKESLTSQEIEAVGASKAADLRERDKRLAEDKAREQKKEERNKKIRKWGILIAIILFLLLLMARCSQLPLPEEIKEVLNIGMEDTIDVEDIEVGRPVEDYDGRHILLTMSMNSTPVFENGLSKGYLNILNDAQNVVAQYVEIYFNKNGEPDLNQKIYTSDLILVGQALPEDTLDVNLPAGQYDCTAFFNSVQFIDKETGKAVCLIKDKKTGALQEVIDRKVIIDEETQQPTEELIVKPFEKDINSLSQIKTGRGGGLVTITINKTATE